MKKAGFTILLGLIISSSLAQKATSDTALLGKVTITKDDRIDLFGEMLAAYNENNTKNLRASKGYRLMLLSTSDRNKAMEVRSRLLQQFPDQKVYMAFQSPFIKLKFGNFTERDEADKFRKQIINQKIVIGNIYIVPETIEVKPDKNADNNK